MDPERNADHKWVREKVIAGDGLSAFTALLKSFRMHAASDPKVEWFGKMCGLPVGHGGLESWQQLLPEGGRGAGGTEELALFYIRLQRVVANNAELREPQVSLEVAQHFLGAREGVLASAGMGNDDLQAIKNKQDQLKQMLEMKQLQCSTEQ